MARYVDGFVIPVPKRNRAAYVKMARVARDVWMELGALDNRTGGQQVSSRVRLTDQLYLIGDLGVEGGFTGRLKYLIRFR